MPRADKAATLEQIDAMQIQIDRLANQMEINTNALAALTA